MARKPKIWFDVDYLSSLGDGPGELYFLSEQSQQILSQLAEVVRWGTRWFDSDGSPVDLPSMAYDVYEELKVPQHLDDLITAINANNAALLAKFDEQILATVESICCPTMSVTIPTGVYTLPGGGTLDGIGDADSVPYSDVEVGVTDLPVTSATDPDGDGIIGPNGARYYLCGAAYWMLEQMVASLRHQANVRRSLGNVAEAVEFVAKVVVAWIIPGWADDIALMEPDKYPGWASLFLEAGADALDSAADTIEANKDAIAQEVACANTSDGMLSLLTAVLGASIGVSGIVTMLTSGPWKAVVNLIYHGAIEVEWREVCSCALDTGLWSVSDHHAIIWGENSQNWATVTPDGLSVRGFWQNINNSGGVNYVSLKVLFSADGCIPPGAQNIVVGLRITGEIESQNGGTIRARPMYQVPIDCPYHDITDGLLTTPTANFSFGVVNELMEFTVPVGANSTGLLVGVRMDRQEGGQFTSQLVDATLTIESWTPA